jgi:hypothetical protein
MACEFTSLEEPTKDDSATDVMKFITDGPEQIGSKRRMTPCVLTWNLKFPIARMIPRLKFANSGRRAGGCGRKPMEPKRIWSPTIVELLLGGKKPPNP